MSQEERMELNTLEREVLSAAFAGEHPALERLRRQLAASRVLDRELTGAGFFTRLAVADPGLALPGLPTKRFGDVAAEVPGLAGGLGFLIYVEDGLLVGLEGYTFADPWPDRIDEFSLSYATGGAEERQAPF